MRKLMVIANPHATAMSARLRERALASLQRAFDVHSELTTEQGHARSLAQAAGEDGFELVAAFGGDGTANEVANGLLDARLKSALDGEATQLRLQSSLVLLPAGQANVLARMLGMPSRAMPACEHLCLRAQRPQVRLIDVASVNGRHFTFSAGVGIDAEVTREVDARPALKARLGPWLYSWAALRVLAGRYRSGPVRLRVSAAGPSDAAELSFEGISAVVQNGDPYTYFRRLPVKVAREAGLQNGSLSGCVLREARAVQVPGLAWRALAPAGQLADHRLVGAFQAAPRVLISGEGDQPLPLHVDGDYLGKVKQAEFSVRPAALGVFC